MNAHRMIQTDIGVPGIYLYLLAEVLNRRGCDGNALLRLLGLNPERLGAQDVRVPQTRAAEFVRRAMHVTGEPGLGLMIASELRMSLHGALGVAVMSSPTLDDALDLGSRFMQLRLPLVRMARYQEGGRAVLRFRTDDETGPLNGFVMDAITVGLVQMGEQLLGGELTGVEIWRRGPRPRYYERYGAQLPAPVRFDMPDDAIRFPARWLSAPIRFSDELAARLSRKQCEQALRQLRADVSMATRVRRVIETSHPFPCSLGRVAEALCLSQRTLKRRLKEEETCYQAQVDRVRLQRAHALLRSTELPMNQVAEALGYADAANFTRAFRRWVGCSPSQYRGRSEIEASVEPGVEAGILVG